MFEIMFFALLMFGFLILLCALYKVAEYLSRYEGRGGSGHKYPQGKNPKSKNPLKKSA